MRHPFWVINLVLLFLTLLVFAFVYFSSIELRKRTDIEPMNIAPIKEQKVTINAKKIYEDDLFGTFLRDITPTKRPEDAIPFPEPPTAQKIIIPAITEPEFLDPLQVTLKGIIVVGSNDAKNRAMVQDNKTLQEGTYKVGDFIQDAQLIRIFKNKVIFLRLNGQQEVLYLREQDAKDDPAYVINHEWEKVIKKINNNAYLINPGSFTEQIQNLTQFINLLNITSAYQEGKSVGLRVGILNKSAMGDLLGLQNGDIILSINTIPTQTTEERLAIYKNITSLKIGNTITVDLMRKNRHVTIVYTLEDFSTKEAKTSQEATEKQNLAFLLPKKNEAIKQQHYAFTPTIDKIRKNDHTMMLQKNKTLMHSST